MDVQKFGKKSLHFTEVSVLGVIAVATVIAILQEIAHMVRNLEVTLADLLLLFIFLEVLAMVGIYLKSGRLPVRLPLYIAIVALARYIIIDMKAMEFWEMIGVSIAILLITVAILILRFGHIRFPYTDEGETNVSSAAVPAREPPASGHDKP